MLCGGLIAYGKLRGTVITKKDCAKTQELCRKDRENLEKELKRYMDKINDKTETNVVTDRQNIMKTIIELKTLLIELNNKQDKRIDVLADKYEKHEDNQHRETLDLFQKISKIEGLLDSIVKSRNKHND